MQKSIRESDWKIFSKLFPVALERLSERILQEIRDLSSDKEKTAHERYLSIFKHIRERDKDMSLGFDGFRRSRALQQMALMRRDKLITSEEFATFSDEFRQQVESYLHY